MLETNLHNMTQNAAYQAAAIARRCDGVEQHLGVLEENQNDLIDNVMAMDQNFTDLQTGVVTQQGSLLNIVSNVREHKAQLKDFPPLFFCRRSPKECC
jgi:hypothetical protein